LPRAQGKNSQGAKTEKTTKKGVTSIQGPSNQQQTYGTQRNSELFKNQNPYHLTGLFPSPQIGMQQSESRRVRVRGGLDPLSDIGPSLHSRHDLQEEKKLPVLDVTRQCQFLG
jgi:hypothetical protein